MGNYFGSLRDTLVVRVRLRHNTCRGGLGRVLQTSRQGTRAPPPPPFRDGFFHKARSSSTCIAIASAQDARAACQAFLTNLMEMELTQWRELVSVMRSPMNSWLQARNGASRKCIHRTQLLEGGRCQGPHSYLPEVPAAVAANNLSALHSQAAVRVAVHCAGNLLVKGRPAASRVELAVGPAQRGTK